MTIEEALNIYLLATSSVTNIVSTRIYPNVIPQDAAMPALAYQRISASRDMAHDGPAGMAYPRFQLTCLATTYGGAKALCNALRVALDGYRGLMGGASGVQVEGIFVENDFDGYNQEGGEQVVRLDITIQHKE